MLADGQIEFLMVWMTFAVLGLIALIVVLLWAVRSRQFSDQDRARSLPLHSGIPHEKTPHEQKKDDGKPPEPGQAGGADASA